MIVETFKASLFNEGYVFKEYVIRKHETGLEFASVKGEMYGVILRSYEHPRAEELNANLRKLRELSYCL